jgi:hypothetical protein
MMAPNLSSVAAKTPPTRRSATSVVVRSMTARKNPLSASFSIDCPPMPVAWKTQASKRSSTPRRTCVTQSVVTPNIVIPTAGRSPSLNIAASAAMPDAARAAFAMTFRDTAFSPAMSTTEAIIVMSVGPMYGAVFPAATVERIIFGTPTGSARMPSATNDVLPVPPIPSTAPMSSLPVSQSARAFPIAPTAAPLSPCPRTASVPSGWQAATSSAETSAVPDPRVDTSTVMTSAPKFLATSAA